MSEVFGISVVQGGATALLAVVFLSVLTGRLVPRSTLQDMIDERNAWREAHAVERDARIAEREQVDELLEMARVGGHLLTSLPYPGQEVSAGDPMDQAPGRPG